MALLFISLIEHVFVFHLHDIHSNACFNPTRGFDTCCLKSEGIYGDTPYEKRLMRVYGLFGWIILVETYCRRARRTSWFLYSLSPVSPSVWPRSFC